MMMMMKNPIILVTCILLFSSLAVLATESSFKPNECCFNFYSTRLPKNKVVGYKYTDKQCTKEGVILVMRNGADFCVKPSMQWVRSIIESKEWVHTKPVTPSEPQGSN